MDLLKTVLQNITSEWAMVFLTMVYVATTISMCISNNKLIRNSNQQLAHEKEKYYDLITCESVPLLKLSETDEFDYEDEIQPVISCEQSRSNFDTEKAETKHLCIENVGESVAKNIRIVLFEWNEVPLNNFISPNSALHITFVFNSNDFIQHLYGFIYFKNKYGVEYSQRVSYYCEQNQKGNNKPFITVTSPQLEKDNLFKSNNKGSDK